MHCTRRHVVLLGLVVVFMLAFTPAAFALAPSVTGVTPADGARFTGGFSIAFAATDANGVNGAATTVTVGSTTYRPNVSYAGYWEGDGCDSWFVEDRTSASFNLSVPDPGPGIFTITIRVPDALGEVTTITRTVTRTAALTFAEKSPSPSGRYASADRVMVTISGGTISTPSVVVQVDGTTIPAAFQSVVPGSVVVTASRSFTAGSHTVSVSAGDGTSAPPATTSWTFSVSPLAAPPYVAAPQPAPGSTVQGAFELRYHVADANGVDGANARVTCDGRVYRASVAYAGYWTGDGCDTWWAEDRTSADLTFSIPDLAPGSHTFMLEVGDASGDWAVTKTTLLRSASLTASAHTPANGSRNSSVSAVSVVLSGSAVNVASALMTIDGSAVPVTVTPSATGTVIGYAGSVAEGTHEVRVSASDTLDSPPMSTGWSFVVDTTPPSVTSLSPAEGATLARADDGLLVRVQDADGIDPASVALSLDGAAITSTFTAEGTGGSVRYGGVLSEGTHLATITARDIAGNAVTRSWTFLVADAPRFGATAPSAALAPEDVLLTAAVADINDDLDPVVRVVVDGADVAATLRLTSPRAGTVEAPLAALADGSHSAAVYVRDRTGNEAVKQWTFTVDAAAPVLQSRVPAANVVLKNHTVALNATFTDAAAIDPSTARAWIDGAPVTISARNDSRWVGQGCDSYEEAIPETLIVSGSYALHDGPHTLKLAATDAFGHVAQQEWAFTVSESPSIVSVRPTAGVHTMESSVVVSASVADFDGIASASLSWRRTGGTWQELASSFDPASGVVSATFPFPAGDSGYEFLITAADAGGLASTATTSIYADASGPVFDEAAILPASGATLVNKSVTFRGRFTDSSTIDPARAVATIDGQPVPFTARHETTWVGSGCDAYEEELPETLVIEGTAVLHDGAHTLRVTSADTFGFPSSREWSFTVKEAPQIAEVAPAANARTTEAAITLSAKLTDYDGVASTDLSWREANQGQAAGAWQTASPTYNAATGVLQATFAFPRNDTRYEFRFSATDTGGLSTTATTSVFAASAAAKIEAGTDCRSCHTTVFQTHPMSNCAACHGSARGPCDCHGSGAHPASWLDHGQFEDHGGGYTGRTCTDCHSHATDVEAQRHASGLDAKCAGCHDQALTAEHQGVVTDSGAFTCSTCHASTDPVVVAAIASGNTGCAACHGVATNHIELHQGAAMTGSLTMFDDHFGSSVTRTVQCSICHSTSQLLTIHANDCDACHAGAKPVESFASWNGTCQQGACHPVIPHPRASVMHSAIANDVCEPECHDPVSWRVADSKCDACHDPAAAAPVTTSDVASTYTLPAEIHLTSPGITYTFYILDGGPRKSGKTLTVPVPASGSQVHTLEFWSVNDAGLEETTHKQATFTMTADTVAPKTTSRGPAYDQATTPTRYSFTVVDPAPSSGVGETYVSVNGAPPVATTSIVLSAEGIYTLTYWSVDKAGNAEAPNTRVVTKDFTPPVTTSNAAATYTGSATIHLTATDAIAGVASTFYAIDGGAQVKGVDVMVSTKGTHTLRFWSTDKASNIEAATSVTFTVN